MSAQASISAALLVPGRSRREVEARARRHRLLWRLVAVLVVLGGAWGVRTHLFDNGAHPRSRVQRVTLFEPTRPPPPKPVEKPPEVELQKKDVEVQTQPEATPDNRQPDNQLGVDADGEGAGDGFGLLGKRGGQDITTLGKARTGESSVGVDRRVTPAQRFGYRTYGGLVAQRLQGELAGRAVLRTRDYVSVAMLWIDARGYISRVELQPGSGHAEVDSALRQAFAEMPQLPEPPAGLPQPLSYRISSRDLNARR